VFLVCLVIVFSIKVHKLLVFLSLGICQEACGATIGFVTRVEGLPVSNLVILIEYMLL